MADVTRKTIRELTLDSQNTLIIGIIINKSESRKYTSKYNDNQINGVLTLTVRDSKKDFINCVIWGSEVFIDDYNRSFRVGDVGKYLLYTKDPNLYKYKYPTYFTVNINSPQITMSEHGRSEQFNPMSSSPYLLTIREGINHISCYDGNSTNLYKELLSIPFKALECLLSLMDIKSNCLQNSESFDFVDLLVAVRRVKPIRDVITKTGNKQCRDVIVMDQSLPGMNLSIWNSEIILRSEHWYPLTTVLFLSDAKLQFSTFHKSVVLGITNKTIIIENPKSHLTKSLLSFVANTSLIDVDCMSTMSNGFPELSTITNIMTVQKIYDQAENNINPDEEQFTALLYAVITKFNIDEKSRFSSRRCIRCRCSMKEGMDFCDRETCIDIQATTNITKAYTKIFDIGVDVTDHSGTLTNCRLIDQFAENVLGFSLDQFERLGADKIIEIKMKYFLERCAIKILFKKKTVVRMNNFISILDMKLVTSEEVSTKIKVY